MTLHLEDEQRTWMASPASRFFHVGDRFFLVGYGWNRSPDVLEFFWSEPDPPGPEGVPRTALWTLREPGIQSRAELLASQPLAARIPGGGFWVVRFDRYEAARFDAQGNREALVSLHGGHFRPRLRPPPGPFGPSDREAYLAWEAEASLIVAPIAFSRDRIGILRQEGRDAGRSCPEFRLDVFDGQGRPIVEDALVTSSARRLIPLGNSATTFDVIEIDKDMMDPDAHHFWRRYAVAIP